MMVTTVMLLLMLLPLLQLLLPSVATDRHRTHPVAVEGGGAPTRGHALYWTL